MNKIRNKRSLTLAAMGLMFLTSLTIVSAEGTGTITEGDNVAISFWIATALMLASTAFFILERQNVSEKWKTSMTVAALVTGVAWYHYTYMRTHWLETGESPLALRYIDWLITVPLLMLEFYFVLAAVNKADSGIFWRLMIGTLVMLVGGYLGEAGYINATLGFIIGMAGWVYILYEVFSGEAGKAASKSGNKALVTAFSAMRMIVTVGWAIYPLGYVFGYLTGGVDANSLNVVYNLADFINKIAFGLVIWAAAVSSAGARSR